MEDNERLDRMEKDINEHNVNMPQIIIAIDHLTKSLEESNTNMREIVKSINSYPLLAQRLKSMDNSIVEYVARTDKRLDKLEDTHGKHGCQPLKSATKEITSLENSRRWLATTIIGAVLLGILNLVITK